MSSIPTRVTRVSFRTHANQFVRAIKPLREAGVLRKRPLREWRSTLSCVTRWGFTASSLLEQAAAQFPTRTAVIDDFGFLTYAELREQARNVARNLKKSGISSGDTVAIQARNSRGIVLPLVACGYLGARPMIVNPASSETQISSIFRNYGADIFFVDSEYIDIAKANPQIPHYVIEDPAHSDWSPTPDSERDPSSPQLKDIALHSDPSIKLPLRSAQQPTVIMSSGTRGIPKGVVVPVPKTPKALGGVAKKIPWRVNLTVQCTASLFHAWGWSNLLVMLVTGATIVLRRNFDPKQAVEDCARYNVNAIISSAVFLREFVRHIDSTEDSIGPFEFIANSGNAIPAYLIEELVEAFGPVVYSLYGSTEHSQISIANSQELLSDSSNAGRPNLGTVVKIFREDGSEAPTGELGEVYSANSLTMLGFLSDKYTPETQDGLLATGDLGYLDKDGYLHLQGRADDMVIKGGENVFPREVEEFLGALDEIADVYVAGVQDDVIAHLDAWVVKSDSAGNLSKTELREKVRSALAEHNVPEFIYWLDELPRNDNGKVVPRWLPDPASLNQGQE